ncbi:LysR family transcriptional regulator [Saccharospirillum mangrovi]|uniref:LysR family transcriptional regulator n=1 Tax=Saccharospirillum mangrovi TaxID=2161747 RepID=UPI000D37FDFF|nr:LysR family transcriptional regulator [Saccharospirillum mangrovi]
MFSQLEALLALVQHGTMSAAALSLRISQSAVSKRIGQLEQQLGKALIRRQGRRALLTAEGEALVAQVAPLMADLKTALSQRQAQAREQVSMAVSEAILSSWGAPLLVQVRDALPELDLILHTHRSPTIVDRVLAGTYPFGICAGELPSHTGLVAERLLDEPMVLVARGGDRDALLSERNSTRPLPVICIEEKSNTWRGIESRARALGLKPHWPVESSLAATRLALSGWGHALAPRGIARLLADAQACVDLGDSGLSRPAYLICRKQVYHQPVAQALLRALQARLPQLSA